MCLAERIYQGKSIVHDQGIPDAAKLRLLLLLSIKLNQGLVQANSLESTDHLMGATSIDLTDRTLPISIDDKTNQVWPHVMTAKVVQSLAEMRLIQINVNENKTFEILSRLLDQTLAIRTVDASIAVVDVVILGLATWRSLKLHSFCGDHLEGSQSERTCLNGIGGRDDVGVGLADVGVWIWVGESGCVRIQWPSSDVNLLAKRNGVGFEKSKTGMLVHF